VALSSSIEKFRERTTAWEDIGIGYAWFSDTFIVYTADYSGQSFAALDNIAEWFSYFLIWVNVPLRGAISCDEFYADSENNLFFGNALIEAYEYGEAQDWIGFLLCPSSVKRLEELGLPVEKRLYYAYADIPYNKRSSNLDQNLPACVLGNWVGVSSNDENPIINKLREMKERITDKKIRPKYDRTIEFLQKNKRVLVLDS
jgi:hypothetical protein